MSFFLSFLHTDVLVFNLLHFLAPLPPHDPLPGPLSWPLLLVYLEVESTSITHREAQAVLPPDGGGARGAVGAAKSAGWGGACKDSSRWGRILENDIGYIRLV